MKQKKTRFSRERKGQSKGRFRTACTTMLDTLAVPAAKVIELYGLDTVPGPTRSIVQRTKALGQRYPRLVTVTEIASWSAIGFDMAYLGAQLSGTLDGIGPMLADITAYTGVMVHPSLVAATIQKVRGMKSELGISQYYQACSIADIAASPVSLAVLGGIVHSGSSGSLSVKRAVTAVLLSSALDFTVWAAGFIPYWAKVIRRERARGVWARMKKVGKGLLHPFRQTKTESAYEEAGRMVGIGAAVWAPPVYMMRVAVAGLVAMAGIAPEAFNQAFFSITNGFLGLIRYVSNGIKNTLVGRLIRRENGGGGEDTK